MIFLVVEQRINAIENNKMSKRQIFHPEQKDKDFVIGAYSDAIEVDGTVYISGQRPVDFATGTFALGTIEEETIKTLHNIKCLIETAGGTLDDVVKCSVHLADIKDWNRFNKVYSDFFTGVRPACITVQSGLGSALR